MKPILFSTPMVQAILDGRKTQTRRIMLPQPETIREGMYCSPYNGNTNKFTFWTYDHKMCLFTGNVKNTAHWKPKYQIGDILYVKETYKFGTYKVVDDVAYVAIDYIAGPKQKTPWVKMQGDIGKILIQCDEDIIKSKIINQLTNKPVLEGEAHHCIWEVGESPYRIRPSLFMPEAYARIFLKVTNVRVERLQDISEEDAIAEGCDGSEEYQNLGRGQSAVSEYKMLWNSINKKEPEKQWQANPYVFVYEFERVEKLEMIA